jgi:hypothetical protein
MIRSRSSWIGSPGIKDVHHKQHDRYIIEMKPYTART